VWSSAFASLAAPSNPVDPSAPPELGEANPISKDNSTHAGHVAELTSVDVVSVVVVELQLVLADGRALSLPVESMCILGHQLPHPQLVVFTECFPVHKLRGLAEDRKHPLVCVSTGDQGPVKERQHRDASRVQEAPHELLHGEGGDRPSLLGNESQQMTVEANHFQERCDTLKTWRS